MKLILGVQCEHKGYGIPLECPEMEPRLKKTKQIFSRTIQSNLLNISYQ